MRLVQKISKKIFTKKNFFFQRFKIIKNSKYIIVCIGTPIDSKLSPKTKKFFYFFVLIKKYK